MSGRLRRSLIPPPPDDGCPPWTDLLKIAVHGNLDDEDILVWRDKVKRARERRERNPIMTEQPVVYYIRFSDRIKIGYSRNLRSRLAVLPHDEILGLEIGGWDVEQLRHRQFAHFNINGEWFQDHPDIRAHAARMREEYPWDY